MTRIIAVMLALFSVLIAALPAYAAGPPQTHFAFPLGANYRPGRYVPVVIEWEPGAGARAWVDAPGVVPTVVRGPGQGAGEAMVPMLVATRIEGMRSAGMFPQVMRPLEEDERLVGFTSPGDDVAAELFPGKRIVSQTLDLADPLPGPSMAWGALDAIVLDAAAAARVSARQLEALRAAGTAVAVRTDARPGGDWPWQRRGDWWVLPPDPAAIVSLVQPERYGPASGAAGAPASARRVVVASLACFATAVLAASLWRDRRAWVVVVAVSVLATGGIACWTARQPTNAAVRSQEQSGPWLDRYTQHVARADGEVRHPIAETDAGAWPILFSARQAPAMNLVLECRADGTPDAFVAQLKRGQSLMFLNRSAAPAATPTPSPATAPAAQPR